MKLVNLTPHEIVIHTDTTVLTIPPSGMVARLVGGASPPGGFLVADGGEVIDFAPPIRYEGVEGVPPYHEGAALVVSAMVGAQAPALLGNKWRGQVFGPDTGATAIRNEKGHIVGVRGLILYW